MDVIEDFGVKFDNIFFEFLVKFNKIVFFLDGFDEVFNSERSKVVRELEIIFRIFFDLRVVVFLRLDLGMGFFFYFFKWKISLMLFSI